MLKEAHAIVAERRGPEISALKAEGGRDGVFAWAGGQPRAGQRATLAYNKACGALRWALSGNTRIFPAQTVGLHAVSLLGVTIHMFVALLFQAEMQL